MTNETRAALKKWLWADYILYDHFRARLRQRTVQYGEERMERDVSRLRRRNADLARACVSERANKADLANSSETARGPKSVYGYRLRSGAPAECEDFVRPETEYAKLIRERQTRRVVQLRAVKP